MKKTFKRSIDSLNALFAFIHEFIRMHKLDEALNNAFDLAMEELFVNMVKYNENSSSDVEIELLKEENALKAVLTDFDVDRFDISAYKPYNPVQALEERRIGGIGIHLVKKLMDDVAYEYKDRQSKIILTKYLRNTYV